MLIGSLNFYTKLVYYRQESKSWITLPNPFAKGEWLKSNSQIYLEKIKYSEITLLEVIL